MNEPCKHAGPLESVRLGVAALRTAPRPRLLALLPLLLLFALMLPVGRPHGGVLRPLCVDGFLFKERQAVDFFSVYNAGQNLLQMKDIYAEPERRYLHVPYATLYRYPPVTALWLAAPLSFLPPWLSYAAWIAFLAILVVANFLLCIGRRPEYLLPLALVWFAWFPMIAEFHLGQFSFFMATLMLWGVDAMRSGRAVGGVAWTLASWIKIYPLAMSPSLFLWGWRKTTAAAVGILIVTTFAWSFVYPTDGRSFAQSVGQTIGGTHLPYAGAQGVQEAINAVTWKLTGRSFGDGDPSGSSLLADPVFILNSLVIAGFAAICAWALWRSRHRFSLETIGILWLIWFVAFRDCWEHHYVFIQALLGLLAAWRLIDWKTMIVCWIFAGAPSLWWFWQRTGYSGNFLTETIGFLYFLQRPMAVIVLAWILVRRLRVPATSHTVALDCPATSP